MLLSDYLKIGEALENIGVFDPVLDKDNAFFINIQRLKETTTPEFEGSYDRINDFFRKIIKLLDRAEQKNVKDTYFRAALDIFKFSEVNGICLGFGEKAPGSGFGTKISKMVLETALHPAQLRDQVTSPGGTTIAGIHALENRGVRAAMYDAVLAVLERSEKLKGK